jgi:hypothetical protein
MDERKGLYIIGTRHLSYSLNERIILKLTVKKRGVRASGRLWFIDGSEYVEWLLKKNSLLRS